VHQAQACRLDSLLADPSLQGSRCLWAAPAETQLVLAGSSRAASEHRQLREALGAPSVGWRQLALALLRLQAAGVRVLLVPQPSRQLLQGRGAPRLPVVAAGLLAPSPQQAMLLLFPGPAVLCPLPTPPVLLQLEGRKAHRGVLEAAGLGQLF
jgi:hypothetical protein